MDEYGFNGTDLKKSNELINLKEKSLAAAVSMIPPNRVRNVLYLMTLRAQNSEKAQSRLNNLREALEDVML
jgi:hypothetical protein